MPQSGAGAGFPGILSVAQFIRERPGIIAVTLRGYGIGLSDLGGAVTWGEARLLLEEASADTATALGAELAGWAYRASLPDLLSIIAQIGDQKASRKVMPWVMKNPRTTEAKATPDEIAVATAEMESGIVFS